MQSELLLSIQSHGTVDRFEQCLKAAPVIGASSPCELFTRQFLRTVISQSPVNFGAALLNIQSANSFQLVMLGETGGFRFFAHLTVWAQLPVPCGYFPTRPAARVLRFHNNITARTQKRVVHGSESKSPRRGSLITVEPLKAVPCGCKASSDAWPLTFMSLRHPGRKGIACFISLGTMLLF